MNKLIKNEFIKILKKKSTFIFIIIAIAFIILANFLSKYSNTISYSSSYSKSMLNFYEEDLKSFDVNDPSDVSIYIDIKTEIDILKLIEKYGFESWQSTIIPQKLSSYIREMNVYEYAHSIDESTYLEAKKVYNNIVSILDKDDWKYFSTEDLKEVDFNLSEMLKQKENTIDKSELIELDKSINSLSIQKQILEWRLEKDISYAPGFLNNELNTYTYYSESIYEYEHTDNHTYEDKQNYYEALEEVNKIKYYVENNITNISESDNRAILLDLLSNYELFIVVFAVMIAGCIISDEFNKGTIKLLLVKPYSRLKILFSKFIVSSIFLILFILFLAIMQLLIGGIIQGFDSLNIPAIIYNHNSNQIETMNIASYILITALAKLPIYFLLMTLAFATSTITKNSAISIVITLLGYMGSEIINMLSLTFNIKFLHYFVTPNWDFTVYLFGKLPQFEGLTPLFSSAICIVYFLIMLVVSSIVFKKTDIKNI